MDDLDLHGYTEEDIRKIEFYKNEEETQDIDRPGRGGSQVEYKLLTRNLKHKFKSALKIYMYPNQDGMRFWCEKTLRMAFQNIGEQLISDRIIGEYQIWVTDDNFTYPNIEWPGDEETDENSWEFVQEFGDWLSIHGDDENWYRDVVGSHLIVHSHYTDGRAESASLEDNGFTKGKLCQVGRNIPDSPSPSKFSNIAIQEVLHNSLIKKEDHKLGEAKGGIIGPLTPMCTTYGMDMAKRGDCNNTVKLRDGYTQELSSCTKDSLDRVTAPGIPG